MDEANSLFGHEIIGKSMINHGSLKAFPVNFSQKPINVALDNFLIGPGSFGAVEVRWVVVFASLLRRADFGQF